MKKSLSTLFGMFLCIAGIPVSATAPPGFAVPQDTEASYRQAIAGSTDVREQAQLLKRLGDLHAAGENYGKAAEAYVQALALGPAAFSEDERLTMAVTISWANRPDDAVSILRSILSRDPRNHAARIHLAKVLSWSSRLPEAAAEADAVLHDKPDNADALLVKANVLRWQGDADASIPLYEKALAGGENFDARIGLAYAHLERGEKDRALQVSKDLKAEYPYQQKELKRFSESLCGVRANRVGIRYSHYADSDHNRVDRSTLTYGFWAGAWDTDLLYRLTDAKDPVLQEGVMDLLISTRRKFGRYDIGAGMGINRNDSVNVVVGEARGDRNTAWGAIGVSAAREALTDTALIIENRIIRTSGMISLSETVSPRFSFTERFIYSGFSDGNNSMDLWLGAKYAVTRSSPLIATGYRFRYLDFRRQSGSGYFDPEDFTSHQVYASLQAEKNGYYAYLEPSVGYQSYTRFGGTISDTFFSLYASAGWTMKRCTAFEIYVEGGNYAGGAIAGYNYYQAGIRLTAYF